MYKKGQIVTACCVIVVAAIFFYQSFSIAQETVSPLGPGFWPRVVTGAIIILGIANLVVDWKNNRKTKLLEETPKHIDKTVQKSRFQQMIASNLDWVSLALMVFYVFVMKPLGFVIASALYLFTQIWLFTFSVKRKYLLYLIISIAIPIGVYYLFTEVFHLLLPTGIFGFI